MARIRGNRGGMRTARGTAQPLLVGFQNLQDEGIYSSEGAGRVAVRRGGQQVFTDQLCLMAIRAVAVDENPCMIFDSHGPSQ